MNKNKQKNFKLIDCFCGAGGLSLGFKNAGFEVKYAFDYDKACVETYRNNIGHHCFDEDINKVNRKSIEEKLQINCSEIDVIAGGPPCQGFSVQRRGSNEDSRNYLVNEFIRLVFEIKPKFFVMENVGGLLSVRGKPFLDKISKICEKEKYCLHIDKLNALDFGVPQDRRRVFLVGERMDSAFTLFEFPKRIFDVKQEKLTVRNAIFDLMRKEESQISNHRGDKLTEINRKRIAAITEGQGRDSLPEDLQLPCHKNNKSHRHLDVYGRMWWDRPSPTITARFDSFSRGRFGHPELNRTITLREGARLQSFPDDFIFYGTKVQVAKQIGNAVPPLLAASMAKAVLQCLSSSTLTSKIDQAESGLCSSHK